MKGITLIGMSGVGKSTIGKLLAQHLNFYFLDLDEHIKNKEGMSHLEIIKQKGDNELLRLEQKYALELTYNKTVFSPGGSIVYSPLAIEKLKNNTTVFYLKASYNYLAERLENNVCARGIVGLKKRGFRSIFLEREPLYLQATNYTINVENKTPDNITAEILQIIKIGES